MKKYVFPIISFLALGIYSVSANATSSAMPRPQPAPACEMKGTATVNVTLNGTETDVSALPGKINTKMHEIEHFAADAKIDKPVVQSMNYNITSRYDNESGAVDDKMESFRYSGNVSYKVTPPERAVDFMALLVKNGFRASLNVNQFRNFQCNQQQ